MATYAPPPKPLTPSSMICFRAGDLLPALEQRASASETGTVCRRDLRRYYWLLSVCLESAPPIPLAQLRALTDRCRAALAAPTADGDLAALLIAAYDLLPGWDALQIFALADAVEVRARREPGPLDLGEAGLVKVSQG